MVFIACSTAPLFNTGGGSYSDRRYSDSFYSDMRYSDKYVIPTTVDVYCSVTKMCY